MTLAVKTPELPSLLELRFVSEGADVGTLSGYASTFGGAPDSYGDIVDPTAFDDTLEEHKAAGTLPAMLWSHDQAKPIGRWEHASTNARGLFVRGKLNLETSAGKDAHAHLKHGDASGLSIGYDSPDRTRAEGGAMRLRKVNLHEVSVVTLPANRRARVTAVRSMGELTDLLREGGLSRGAAQKIAQAGWPALSGGAPVTPENETLVRRVKARALELERKFL